MNYFISAVVTVSLCLSSTSALSLPSLSGLASALSGTYYELSSTVRVVDYLCNSGKVNINDQLATDFFNCYDAAPAGGRAIYTNCQIKVNGVEGVMNTTAGIQETCKGLYTFPLYAKCLSEDFRKACISLSEAVTNVNLCEEKVLGIRQ